MIPNLSLPGMSSLTAGGGLSTSSSAETGDQRGGVFETGSVSSGGGAMNNQTLIMMGLALAAAVAVYAISSKKR